MDFSPGVQRKVMGRFATGVTVVTTCFDDKMYGMTANAVISLSLDPALVGVSVDKKSSMHEFIGQGECFAINILRREQEEISNRFSTPGPKNFSDIVTEIAQTGAPILCDALAWLDCNLRDIIDVGDHDLFIGEPLQGHVAGGLPLLYYGGHYDGLLTAKVREDRS